MFAGPRRIILGLGVLAGLGVRVWTATHHAGSLDSDEAVVGLMAMHILKGQFPVFYWGQPDGGAIEAYITAVLFAVFGTSTFALKLVPCALDAAAAVLVVRVGRRIMPKPAANLAGLLFWMWPAAFVWSSIKARGFYGAALVASVLVILLALRLRDEDRRSDWFWLGLTLGVR